ncbi:hypothetical protein MXB_2916 [Myxobolus squamalis]|nr:hypothetical protein MXB_2916 [Myxobolus squamalis]
MYDKCDPLSETLVIVATTMSSTVISVSIIMNLLLPSVIFTDPTLRKRSNIYLGCFSLSLCLFSIWLIADVISMKKGYWVGGNALCKSSAFFVEFSMVSSSFILLWVCLDRYLMIFKANVYNKLFNNVLLNMAVSILVAVILCIPFPILYSKRKTTCIDSGGKTYEVNTCEYDYSKISLVRFIFIIETILVFVLPTIIMIFLYSKILMFIRKTNKSNSPISHCAPSSSGSEPVSTILTSQKTSPNPKLKKPISKLRFSRGLITALTIIIFYVVTWTPFLVVRIISLIEKNMSSVIVRSVQFIFLLYLCFYPLIYIATNQKIRNSLIKKLKFSH